MPRPSSRAGRSAAAIDHADMMDRLEDCFGIITTGGEDRRTVASGIVSTWFPSLSPVARAVVASVVSEGAHGDHAVERRRREREWGIRHEWSPRPDAMTFMPDIVAGGGPAEAALLMDIVADGGRPKSRIPLARSLESLPMGAREIVARKDGDAGLLVTAALAMDPTMAPRAATWVHGAAKQKAKMNRAHAVSVAAHPLLADMCADDIMGAATGIVSGPPPVPWRRKDMASTSVGQLAVMMCGVVAVAFTASPRAREAAILAIDCLSSRQSGIRGCVALAMAKRLGSGEVSERAIAACTDHALSDMTDNMFAIARPIVAGLVSIAGEPALDAYRGPIVGGGIIHDEDMSCRTGAEAMRLSTRLGGLIVT